MKFRKLAIRTLTAVLIGTIGALALYWRLEPGKSIVNPEARSNEEIWSAVLCRAQLYSQKAKGEVSEVSWAELWGLTLPGRGYHCTEGSSLESSIQFSADATEDDRKEGA